MGLISDIKAVGDVEKIKKGGKAKLSISQITGLIINLSDAKKQLPDHKFDQVYDLFKKLRTCNTKMKMNYEGYLQQAVAIIKRFDAIAPYEKYSGGNEMEFSFFMDEIRSETSLNNFNNSDYVDKELETYVKYIVQESKGILSLDDATKFVDILLLYSVFGKEKTLDAFDDFVEALVNKHGISSITIVPFLIGLLNSNGVITSTESNNMTNSFTNKFCETFIQQNQ